MVMLGIKLKGILKVRIEVIVDNMVDKVYVVVLRIFKAYFILNDSIR